MTKCEAIIEAFKALGGERSIPEISQWIREKYGDKWKDFGVQMADMVYNGNPSSTAPQRFRVLENVSYGNGVYMLIE